MSEDVTSDEKKQQQLELFEEWFKIRDPSRSHYPSLLSLVSMFLPVKDRKRGDTSGWGEKDGEFYRCNGVTIQRFGPGLSTYDEDTLIAIIQLACERSLIGTEADVRNKYLPLFSDNDKDTDVDKETKKTFYIGNMTYYRINKYIGRETSGSGLKSCRDSVNRLSKTTLDISSSYSSKSATTGFFRVVRDENEKKPFTVVIEPIMAKYLIDYVIMDLNIRKALSPVGKSVYRYFIGSGENRIPLLDLMESIGFDGSIADFKRILAGRKGTAKRKGKTGELDVMIEIGWLKNWEITGTGRNEPMMLDIDRAIQ